MNKKWWKYNLILICFVLFGSSLLSQNMDVWYKLSPEIRLSFSDNNWEFRWRPVDVVVPHNIGRTDFLIGRKIKSFKVFSYSKFDADKRYWTGLRLDYNKKLLNNKALLNLQGRLFFGLNENSKHHYYHVQFFNYDINKTIGCGVLGYSKTNFNEKSLWFIGPSTMIKINKTFRFHFAFTKDIFQDNLYMWLIRLNVKIKVKKG